MWLCTVVDLIIATVQWLFLQGHFVTFDQIETIIKISEYAICECMLKNITSGLVDIKTYNSESQGQEEGACMLT